MNQILETASYLWKVFGALSLILGALPPLLELFGTRLPHLSRSNSLYIAGGLLMIAAGFGTIDYLGTRNTEAGRGAKVTPSPAVANVKNSENVLTATNIINSTIHQVSGGMVVNVGDSPEVKANKIRKSLEVHILATISNLDTRLTAVQVALSPNEFDSAIEAARRRVAPALAEVTGHSYRALIAEQRVASLRAAFNGAPLQPEVGDALIRFYAESNADPGDQSRFYAFLADAANASEALLSALALQARADPQAGDTEVKAEELRIRRSALTVISKQAYVTGLLTLGQIGSTREEVSRRLSALNILEPKQLVPGPELNAEVERLANERLRLNEEKAELVARHKARLVEQLREFEALPDALKIKSDDPWDIVAGKARALRELGHEREAIAAYGIYRDLFASSDPTASLFATVAEQFTQQFRSLPVKGGVYVYEVRLGGAREGGLHVGDVITKYGQREIRNMVDFDVAVREEPPIKGREIRFLRLLDGGRFVEGVVTLPSDSLGLGAMPI
jgi:hypothetical protein